MSTETKKRMKVVTITSGNFSGTEDGKQNNFSGYDLQGERYFINRNLMESINIKEDKEFTKFYVVVATKTYNTLDEDRNPVIDTDGNAVTFDRLQATAVFKTKAEANEAVMDSETNELEQLAILLEKKLELGASIEAKKQKLEISPETMAMLVDAS